MKLSKLTINNFRNFQHTVLDLTNKNVIFGMNDIGKTNFLCAIRFLLDRDYRRNGFIDSDYYDCKTKKEISICLEIDITNEQDEDNRKIYSCIKGATLSIATKLFIQLKSVYNLENLHGEAELFWGPDQDALEAIPSNQSYYDIDKLFNVVYIDSSIQLDYVFKKYSRELFKTETSLEEKERNEIKSSINKLNQKIGDLSNIKKFASNINEEYKKFRDEEWAFQSDQK